MIRFASLILCVVIAFGALTPTASAQKKAEALCACYHDDGLCTVHIDEDGSKFAESHTKCNTFCEAEYRTCRSGKKCITDTDCPLGTSCESNFDNKPTLWAADDTTTAAKADRALCEADHQKAEAGKKKQAGDEAVNTPIIPQLAVAIPGLNFSQPVTRGNTIGVEFIGPYIKAGYEYALGIALLICVVLIMIGGVQYMLGAGSDNVVKAKLRIKNAVIGFILLLCVYLILYIANPSLTILRESALEGIPRIEFDLPAMEQTANAGGVAGTSPPGGAGFNGVPAFKQGAAPWGSQAFGDKPRCEPGGKDNKSGKCCSSYAWAGCGPTAMAMVLKFHGENVDPRTVGVHATKTGARVCNNGTNNVMAREVAKTWPNFRARLVSPKRVMELWKRGEKIPVLTGVPRVPGCWENPGQHWIVLTGLDDKGFIRVNDPAGGTCFDGRNNSDGFIGKKGLGMTHVEQRHLGSFTGFWVVAPKDKIETWFK